MIYKEIKEIHCIECQEQLPQTDSSFTGSTNYDVENTMFVCDKCLEAQDHKHEFDSPHRLGGK